MNRIRIRIVLAIVVCAVTASVLMACGSDDSDPAGSPGTTSIESAESSSDDDSSGGYSY